jgi:hypothetical protein
MTQDEIIKMLRNAGAIVTPIGFVTEPPTLTVVDVMERFAKLVAQREREAWVKVCDEMYYAFQVKRKIENKLDEERT